MPVFVPPAVFKRFPALRFAITWTTCLALLTLPSQAAHATDDPCEHLLNPVVTKIHLTPFAEFETLTDVRQLPKFDAAENRIWRDSKKLLATRKLRDDSARLKSRIHSQLRSYQQKMGVQFNEQSVFAGKTSIHILPGRASALNRLAAKLARHYDLALVLDLNELIQGRTGFVGNPGYGHDGVYNIPVFSALVTGNTKNAVHEFARARKLIPKSRLITELKPIVQKFTPEAKPLPVKAAVYPFSQDKALQEAFKVPFLPELDAEARLIGDEYLKVRAIKNEKLRSNRAVRLLPKIMQHMQKNGIEFQQITNSAGHPAFIITPSEATEVNRFARLTKDRYAALTVFDFWKNAVNGFSASATMPGDDIASLQISLPLILHSSMAYDIEGHELVHLETDARLQAGKPSIFSSIIYLRDRDFRKRLPYRTGLYDSYVSVDELQAYTHTLIERTRLLTDPNRPERYKKVDFYARFLRRIAMRINASVGGALHELESRGAYFTIEQPRMDGEPYLAVRIETDIENFTVYLADRQQIELRQHYNIVQQRKRKAEYALIEHEANHGELARAIDRYVIDEHSRNNLRRLTRMHAASQAYEVTRLGFQIEVTQAEDGTVNLAWTASDEQFKQVAQNTYPVQNSLQQVKFREWSARVASAKQQTSASFDLVRAKLTAIDEVTHEVIRLTGAISRAAKARNDNAAQAAVEKLAAYLNSVAEK